MGTLLQNEVHHQVSAATQAGAPAEKWIALLGRGEAPADGIRDYCGFLSQALTAQGIALEILRFDWPRKGWLGALSELWSSAAVHRARWVLLQYTALAWSRRGFPLGSLAVVSILRLRGVACAIMYHEPRGIIERPRLIYRIRGACQDFVVRALHRLASKSIFADPLESIPWLPRAETKSVFIPIGSNIPERLAKPCSSETAPGGPPTIVVFCLGDPPHLRDELHDISTAIRFCAHSGINAHLIFLGRGTAEAKNEIAQAFNAIPTIRISVLGLVSAEEASQALAAADVMLCVRGKIYPRRSSAIAGIACGLPLVGYAGEAEGTPLEKAGLLLVPYRDAEALGHSLVRLFTDPHLRRSLREQSARAQQEYFSWDRIARSFAGFLRETSGPTN